MKREYIIEYMRTRMSRVDYGDDIVELMLSAVEDLGMLKDYDKPELLSRSETVQHIEHDLEDRLSSPQLQKSRKRWCRYMAEEILDMLEGFGMQPPGGVWKKED